MSWFLKRGGDVHGLVVGRVVKQDFRCRFGYKTISLGQVRELSVIYGGVLGCDDVESAEVVMIELNRILKCREVDLVFLSHLSTDSHYTNLRHGGQAFSAAIIWSLHNCTGRQCCLRRTPSSCSD